MDKPVVPLTPDEEKQLDDAMEAINAIVSKLPKSIEYSITVGVHHVHWGQVPYHVFAAAEALNRMCHNVAADHENEPGVLEGLAAVAMQAHKLMAIIGPGGMIDVAKKYNVPVPPEMMAMLKLMEALHQNGCGCGGSCKSKKDIDLSGEGGADA